MGGNQASRPEVGTFSDAGTRLHRVSKRRDRCCISGLAAGLGGKEVVVIQCKRKREVGVDAARELLGVVSADRMVSRGFLVVSGRLSRGCREFINQHGMLSAIEGLELARRAMKLGIDV